jgi:hypothetical protein
MEDKKLVEGYCRRIKTAKNKHKENQINIAKGECD